ncbi:MAG: MFS transporter [Candidatus Dormibacteraceae bacterium]
MAIGYLWQSLGTLILPGMVQQMVGNAHKGVALSVLEGIGTAMAVVWQPVVGAISDRTRTRWGRRHPYILGGTVGDLVFLTGLALSGSYWVVVVFYFLLQTASNTAQGPYQGLLPDVVPEDQRGAASGYYGLANLIGILAGTVGAGVIQAHLGREVAIASIAVLLAASMLATVLMVPDRAVPARDQFGSPWQATVSTFSTPLGHPDFMWLMGSRLLILMGIVGIQSFVLFFFSDTFFHGDTKATVTATYTLLGLVIALAIVTTWPAARISDRVGRKPMVVAGGLLAASGTLALAFSHFHVIPPSLLAPIASALKVPELAAQAMVAGIPIGIGFGAFISIDWAFMTDVIPIEEAGLFMGFSNIATAGSGIIARFVAGFLLDYFNARGRILGLPGGYPVLFVVFFVWLVAGTALVLRVRERR